MMQSGDEVKLTNKKIQNNKKGRKLAEFCVLKPNKERISRRKRSTFKCC